MIWFTSDLHFNHAKIIDLCKRPFGSVVEMNEKLIEAWNSRVDNADEVHVLGDFAFWYKDAQSLDDIFYRLNGEKHLVVGNHDEQNAKVLRLPWKTQKQISHVRYGEQRFVLCHFPLESWWHAERGVLHLHGHCHGSLRRRVPHRFDVGVDVLGHFFTPLSAPELITCAEAQAFTATDHHI